MRKKVFLSRLNLTLLTAVVFFISGFFITSTTIAKPFQSSLPTVIDPGYLTNLKLKIILTKIP
jgi:hypothetical protein